MNLILENILKDTFTIQQLRSRSRLLKEHLASLYYKSKDPSLEANIYTWESLNWLNKLDKSFLVNLNKDNLNDQFNNLEQEISQLKTIIIYFAVEFPSEELDKIASDIRQIITVNKDSYPPIFDVKLNPSLLAGCILVIDGVAHDFSLKKKIDEQKVEILSQFKSFLR